MIPNAARAFLLAFCVLIFKNKISNSVIDERKEMYHKPQEKRLRYRINL